MDQDTLHHIQGEESEVISSRSDRSDPRFITWAALSVSLIVSAVLSLRLGQDVNWDLQNYHVYGGYAFLNKRFFYDFAPAQLQTFLNPLMHVLSFLLRIYLSPKLAAILLGAIQGLNIFLVFQISQVLFRRLELRWRLLLSAANAAAGFYASVNYGELGTTYGDSIVSIPLLAGILILVRYMTSEKAERLRPILRLCLGGALVGISFALKLTIVVHVAAIAFALPLAMLVKPTRFRIVPLLSFYGGITAGFLVGYGMWGARLYMAYKNPFFPFFNNIFRSPYYAFRNAMDVSYVPHAWSNILFSPFLFARETMLAGERMHRDIRWALCYISILLLVGFALYRFGRKTGKICAIEASERETRCLLLLSVFIVISYVCWQYLFFIYRYLSVLEWIAPTFLALTLAWFIRSPRLILAGSLLINAGICYSVVSIVGDRIPYDLDFLKVEIPPIPNLHNHLILMAGPYPTSYIIPQFPPHTRFVRISSNWMMLGENAKLDRHIHDFIAQYDVSRILLYCADEEEITNADITLFPLGLSKSDHACQELGSPLRHKGFLCEVDIGIGPSVQPSRVKFVITPFGSGRRSNTSPSTLKAGKDTVVFHVMGLPAKAIDVLCTLDGRPLPPQRNWMLNASQEFSMAVGPSTQKGVYRFIGIRDSAASDPNRWLKIDASIQVR
jgi:hypothetical protein